MEKMRFWEFAVLLVLALMAPAIPIGAAQTTAGEQAATPVEPLTGTVKAIDLRGRTVTLLTGVGYSLRLVRVTLPQGLTVQGVAPGCVVRVECAKSKAGRVAKTMTVLRSPRGEAP